VLDGLDDGDGAWSNTCLRWGRANALVTGHAPLRINGEHVLNLSRLDVPARPEDLERAAAGALLLSEARRADMRFKLLPTTRSSLVQLCHLVRGLPLGLIMAARALPATSSASLVGAIESALTTPVFGDRRTESWWTSPQWASVLDTLEMMDRPRTGSTRQVAPLAIVCTPDQQPTALIDRLREEGMVVCVTQDLPGCLRVATSVGPDVVLIDPRIPRRLEQLLRAHPVSSAASIRWLSEAAANGQTHQPVGALA
jgi:hypothetical protein